MVMLTRDRGFGFVGMKPEVVSGLMGINMQASGRDRPGACGDPVRGTCRGREASGAWIGCGAITKEPLLR